MKEARVNGKALPPMPPDEPEPFVAHIDPTPFTDLLEIYLPAPLRRHIEPHLDRLRKGLESAQADRPQMH